MMIVKEQNRWKIWFGLAWVWFAIGILEFYIGKWCIGTLDIIVWSIWVINARNLRDDWARHQARCGRSDKEKPKHRSNG